MNYKWCFIINLIENTFIKNFYKTNPNIVGIYDYNSYHNIYIHTLNSKYFIQDMIFENNETNETTNYYTLCFNLKVNNDMHGLFGQEKNSAGILSLTRSNAEFYRRYVKIASKIRLSSSQTC